MTKVIDGVMRQMDPVCAPVALVVDSPHSGRVYPADYRYACGYDELRSAEDAYVDDLCAAVPAMGGSLLIADFPRAYIDPNRELNDLNPELVDGECLRELRPGEKTRMGIGLVREKLSNGASIYSGCLSANDIEKRIANYYIPYHDALSSLLGSVRNRFGSVWHIDMHSMASHGNVVTPDALGRREYDMVLGDLDGRSCDASLTELVRYTLQRYGYRVRVNDPYKGAAITRRYGKPAQGVHTLQIEINRELYLDESRTSRNDGFQALKGSLTDLFGVLARNAPVG